MSCVWCDEEGRSRVAVTPSGPSPSMCWTHRLRMLLAAPMVEGRHNVRLVVVVARHEAELFARVSDQLLDEPRVSVVLDRRRGDGSRPPGLERRQARDADEDLQGQPAAVVLVRGVQAPRGAGAPSVPTPGSAPAAADVDARPALSRWLSEGQELLGGVIPAVLADYDRARARLERAEQSARALRQDIVAARDELRALREALERARRRSADLADVLHGYLAEAERLTNRLRRAAHPH